MEAGASPRVPGEGQGRRGQKSGKPWFPPRPGGGRQPPPPRPIHPAPVSSEAFPAAKEGSPGTETESVPRPRPRNRSQARPKGRTVGWVLTATFPLNSWKVSGQTGRRDRTRTRPAQRVGAGGGGGMRRQAVARGSSPDRRQTVRSETLAAPASRTGITRSLTRPPLAAHTRARRSGTGLSAPSRRQEASGPGCRPPPDNGEGGREWGDT